MALSGLSINHTNIDFSTTGGTDFLRGNIQDNIRVEINFTTTAPIAEVEVKLGFLNNATSLYPTAGSFKIPDSYFNNATTGDIQSWKGSVGILNPNNVKRWNEGIVRLFDLGGNNYQVSALIKLKPLILFQDINNGELDASQSQYAGNKAFKTIFEINTFTNVGDATPFETTINNDLGGEFFPAGIIKYGQTGYINEYLNGNAPIYSVTGYQETASSFRALLTRTSGSFLATDKVIIKFQRVTNEFNNDLDLDDNLLYFEFDCFADGLLTPIADRIENITATISGSNLIIDVTYNANFFYGVSNYAITATVGATGTAEATHERTTALINFKDFAYPFSEDLFEIRAVDGIEKALFYNQIGTSINNASDNVEGYPEHVQLLKFNFGIKRAVYSVDEATLTNLTIKISDDNGTFQSRSFVTSQNFEQTRGLYLQSSDELNLIKLDITEEENYIDNTGLKVINQYTLQRFDDGDFFTDGFAFGDAVTITGDITNSSTITALTAEVMTLSDPIDIQYVGRFWTVNINGTDYTNFPAEGIFNYKLFNVAYPFVILPSWVSKTGLKIEIEMAVSQLMPDNTVQSDTFVYRVNDFILYDYNENNTVDTTMTGSIQLSDETSVQLSNGIFLDQNTKVVSTFNQTGLDASLMSAIGYNNINLLAGAEQTNQYFSSHVDNKSGAFIGANAVISSPSANNLSVASTLDYTLLEDIDYRLSSLLFIPASRFVFLTIIDPLVDGNFTPQIIGGTNSRFTFKDGSFINSNNISTSGNGLDGTVQEVVFSWDTTEVTDVLIANDKIYGHLDLSAFTGNTSAGLEFILDFNDDITSITMPTNLTNNLVRFRMQDLDNIKELDFTPFGDKFSGQIDFRSGMLLEKVTFPATTQTVLNIIGLSNPLLMTNGIDLSPMTNFCNINNHQTRFDSCDFSSEQVNKILIDIDAVAVGGFTGRTVILGGSNSAPTGAGVTAKNNLITKGFTVTTS